MYRSFPQARASRYNNTYDMLISPSKMWQCCTSATSVNSIPYRGILLKRIDGEQTDLFNMYVTINGPIISFSSLKYVSPLKTLLGGGHKEFFFSMLFNRIIKHASILNKTEVQITSTDIFAVDQMVELGFKIDRIKISTGSDFYQGRLTDVAGCLERIRKTEQKRNINKTNISNSIAGNQLE